MVEKIKDREHYKQLKKERKQKKEEEEKLIDEVGLKPEYEEVQKQFPQVNSKKIYKLLVKYNKNVAKVV